VPHGEQFEARVRGPNVTPGYWKRLDLTASAFDAEGFFKTGEAVRFADRARPERGLVYDGRVSSFELDRFQETPSGALGEPGGHGRLGAMRS
jgi:feruloyl-CoA synthase